MTVGVLVTAIAICLLLAALRRSWTAEVPVLALASAAGNVAVCAAGEWLDEPVGDVMGGEVLAKRGAREAGERG